MSKKEEMEIFEKFKKIETQLIQALKTIPEDVSKEGKPSEKENIESYIKKVANARKLFDEYEGLAEKLNELNSKNENDQDSIDLSKKVIDSRRTGVAKINEKELLSQYKAMEKQTKGLEKVEIETLGDKVIVKKKKKKNESASKEL